MIIFSLEEFAEQHGVTKEAIESARFNHDPELMAHCKYDPEEGLRPMPKEERDRLDFVLYTFYDKKTGKVCGIELLEHSEAMLVDRRPEYRFAGWNSSYDGRYRSEGTLYNATVAEKVRAIGWPAFILSILAMHPNIPHDSVRRVWKQVESYGLFFWKG
jgi:hypothetical protein